MKHSISIAVTLVLVVLITLLFYGTGAYWIGIGSVLFLHAALTGYGSYQIRLNYFIHAVNKGSSQGITLTFDDGPDPELTLQIADLLDHYHIKGTFFVIGHKVDAYPEIIKELHRRGHTIANHSYSHSNMLPLFSTRKLTADIQACTKSIELATGERVSLFRPPFGVTNPNYKRALSRLNMTAVGWSVRSYDTTIKDESVLLARIIKRIKPESILLFHDTQQVTLKVLPGLINYCRSNGINIVSLQELTQLQSYEVI